MTDEHLDETNEEISLGYGSGGPLPRTDGDEGDPEGASSKLNARRANLEGIVGPGCSNSELVDAVIQLAPEQLIPWEVCFIPSNGLYYDWPTPTVEVRAMGQAAEKVLANQRLAQTGQNIDHLFRECVRFPDPAFDPADLLVGDRIFLLYYLRGITHGNMYEFAITCPNQMCTRTSTHSYDLNNLASTIRRANPSLGREPFKVTLPYMSESTNRDFWVGLRFLRSRDVDNMLAMRRTKKRAFATPAVRAGRDERSNPFQRREQEVVIDDTMTENLQLVIASVMDVQDRGRINAFVNRMHATDTSTIREWLRDNSPGIDTTVTIDCPECSQPFTVELPITESFFRPTQKRGVG